MIWALLACAAEALNNAPSNAAARPFDPGRVPVEPGIYRLRGEDFTPLPANTTLGTASSTGQAPVRYPLLLPATAPTFAPDDLLLLVGGAIDTWSVATLAPTPQVPGLAPLGETGPWFVLTSAAAPVSLVVERLTPTDPPARTLAAGALPAGRYVLSAVDSARALVFDATRP